MTWGTLGLSCLLSALGSGFICYWTGYVQGEVDWRMKHGGKR